MVSLAVWIFCTLFVVWCVVNAAALIVWAVATVIGKLCALHARWDREHAERHLARKRRSLGYS